MTPVILLAACFGYLFSVSVHRLRYLVLRFQNWHLFFVSLNIGFFFLSLSFGLNKLLCIYSCNYVDDLIYGSVLAGLMAIIALSSGIIMNLIFTRTKSIKQVLQDDLSRLILRSMEMSKEPEPIQFTLNTRKIYIGYVTSSLEPLNDADAYISLLPMQSGYRDPKTLELVLENDYTPFWENEDFDLSTLETVIPKKEIVTANIFNWDIYYKLNS